MSNTPIREKSERRDDDPAVSGVRARLRAAGQWLLQRLQSVGTDASTTSEEDAESTESCPEQGSKQQTTAVSTTALEPASDRATARPAMPSERSDFDTERAGDSFRVYDPEDPDAYISSDNWVPVER